MPYIITTNTVAKARKKAGLTQEELAIKAAVSRQTIISIEKGHYTPSVLLALTLAKICRTSVENLFEVKKIL